MLRPIRKQHSKSFVKSYEKRDFPNNHQILLSNPVKQKVLGCSLFVYLFDIKTKQNRKNAIHIKQTKIKRNLQPSALWAESPIVQYHHDIAEPAAAWIWSLLSSVLTLPWNVWVHDQASLYDESLSGLHCCVLEYLVRAVNKQWMVHIIWIMNTYEVNIIWSQRNQYQKKSEDTSYLISLKNFVDVKATETWWNV